MTRCWSQRYLIIIENCIHPNGIASGNAKVNPREWRNEAKISSRRGSPASTFSLDVLYKIVCFRELPDLRMTIGAASAIRWKNPASSSAKRSPFNYQSWLSPVQFPVSSDFRDITTQKWSLFVYDEKRDCVVRRDSSRNLESLIWLDIIMTTSLIYILMIY